MLNSHGLAQMLRERQILSAEEATSFLQREQTGQIPLAQILLQEGRVTEKQLVEAHASQIGLLFVDFARVSCQPQAMSGIPVDLIRKHRALPYRLARDGILVAISDPTNKTALEEIARVSGKKIYAVLAERYELTEAIERMLHAREKGQQPHPSGQVPQAGQANSAGQVPQAGQANPAGQVPQANPANPAGQGRGAQAIPARGFPPGGGNTVVGASSAEPTFQPSMQDELSQAFAVAAKTVDRASRHSTSETAVPPESSRNSPAVPSSQLPGQPPGQPPVSAAQAGESAGFPAAASFVVEREKSSLSPGVGSPETMQQPGVPSSPSASSPASSSSSPGGGFRREGLLSAADAAFLDMALPTPGKAGQASPVLRPEGPLARAKLPGEGSALAEPLRRSEETTDSTQHDESFELHINDLLGKVLDLGASDLHLAANSPPIVRVDGDLRPLSGMNPLKAHDLQKMIFGILTQKQRETLEAELELDASHPLPGRARFRINVYYQRQSIGAVMRVIPNKVVPLEKLGLPPIVHQFASYQRGLVLVTGPTGSGKSTTLASLVDIINSEKPVHIMTVEDPIEFLHTHKRAVVNQREVGQDTKSFSRALKSVLRQDPDVILVGEMRDLETIQTALTASETGHLVFATLHTQDAPQTIDRIIDVFPPHQQQQVRVQLATSLQAVLTQQLIRSEDGHGRNCVVEVMIATPAIRNLIREGKIYQIYSSMQAGGGFGMQTMDQALAELVSKRKISYEIAQEKCSNAQDLARLCGRI